MHNPPTLEDILKIAPKQFCDSVNGGFNKENFFLAMFSGQNATVFALTPSHMKKLVQWADYKVKAYEKDFGTIEAEWDPNIPSPIKTTDLNKTEEEE